MLAAVRPMGLPIKGYATLLGGLSVAGFLAGSWINYDYARKTPGADPYLPHISQSPQFIAPALPVVPKEPIFQDRVKVLPIENSSPVEAPLISDNNHNKLFVPRNPKAFATDTGSDGRIGKNSPPAATPAAGDLKGVTLRECVSASEMGPREPNDIICIEPDVYRRRSIDAMTGAGSIKNAPKK